MGRTGREKCAKKRVFWSLRDAHFVALEMRQKSYEENGGMDRTLNGYRCKYCKWYHVGHGQPHPKAIEEVRQVELEYEKEIGKIIVTTPHLHAET